MKALIISLFFLSIFSLKAQDFKMRMSASLGANFATVNSFSNEISNAPKPGHTIIVNGFFGNKIRFTPGITLRHYKNEVVVGNFPNVQNHMSVDLLNYRLGAEGLLFTKSKFSLWLFTGLGLDHYLSIKSKELVIDKNDFHSTVLTALGGLRFQLSRFFLSASYENGMKGYYKPTEVSNVIYEFTLGTKLF